jgi:Family of unknown function (DUF5690)
VADAAGYGGSVVLLVRSLGAPKISWVSFYEQACYAVAACVVLLIAFLPCIFCA